MRNCVESGMEKGTGSRVRILLFALIFGMFFARLVIAACPDGDLDGDCIVNLDDLLILAEHWMDPDCADPSCGNLDGINGVTMADFAKMGQVWQKKGSRLVISEFLASNSSIDEQEGFVDEDNDSSDWIEIYNPTDVAVNLESWFLTDNKSELTKWQFPSVTISAGDYLIVFASEKNRTNPGSELHTNFKLSADGEYLALVMPDGQTVVSEFAPEFPRQISDISYGLSTDLRIYNFVESGMSAQILVPQDGGLGTSWTLPTFTIDGNWTTAPTGIGYDTGGSGIISTAPIAYWPMDETSGSTALDFTGNGYDGTIDGSASWTDGNNTSAVL